MIDLRALEADPTPGYASQKARGEDPALIDQAIAADRKRREALSEFESARAEQKSVSKSVGKASPEERPAVLAKAKELAAHVKELEAARKVAEWFHVKHYEFDLSSILQYSNCALLAGSSQEIKHESYEDQVKESETGRVSTCVPFRNGLMLSVAASLAASLYEDEEVDIYIGAHADDAAGNAYADCSEPFLQAMEDAISIGTYGKVHLVFPFADKNKAGVVKTGLALGTPYELTWSCYEGGEKPCGTCGTCRDRIAAFEANGVKDPALD